MRNYKVRRLKKKDYPQCLEIAKKYENNELVDEYKTGAVVTENNKMLGFGVTRGILEAVLYCAGSKRERTIAFKKLLDQAISDARELGTNQLYVFVDSDFGNILQDKFGFAPTKGVSLVLNLGDENGK